MRYILTLNFDNGRTQEITIFGSEYSFVMRYALNVMKDNIKLEKDLNDSELVSFTLNPLN